MHSFITVLAVALIATIATAQEAVVRVPALVTEVSVSATLIQGSAWTKPMPSPEQRVHAHTDAQGDRWMPMRITNDGTRMTSGHWERQVSPGQWATTAYKQHDLTRRD